MKLRVIKIIKKIKNIFIISRKLYFITNSTAYKELKLKGIFSNKKSCCIFVGEYFDSKSNTELNNFTLPLSAIRFKPYTPKAKLQVIYCDFLQLIICIFFKIYKGRDKEIIFTSVMNSRTLYILDLFIKNLKVIEWQYKYIYKYLIKYYKNKKINFKYGDFIFRANHKLRCKIDFPLSLNDKFNELIEYHKEGNVLIVHNPNRNYNYWLSLNKLIENHKGSNLLFFLLIHPKTFEEEKRIFFKIFANNLNNQNIVFSSLNKIIENKKKFKVSLCYSLSSSLDFILYANLVPIVSPLKLD